MEQSSQTETTPRSRFGSARLWLAIAVVAAWLASMHAVWVHEAGRGGRSLKQVGISPDVLLITWTGYEHHLMMIQNGRAIGWTQMSIFRREGRDAPKDRLPGYEMSGRTRIKFQILGLPLPVDISMNVTMNAAFEMETLQGAIMALGRPMNLDAFTEGNKLYYRIHVGEAANNNAPLPGGLEALLAPRDLCGRTPLAGPILMHDVLLPLMIHEGKIAPGQSWETQSSDPIAGLLHQSVRVSVVGREKIRIGKQDIDAWHFTEQVGEMKSQAYYGPDGKLLRRDAPNGLTMIAADVTEIKKFDPKFGRAPQPEPIDRDFIRAHLDPKLTDKPLETLLPGLPSM